jgi:hypothetical protein
MPAGTQNESAPGQPAPSVSARVEGKPEDVSEFNLVADYGELLEVDISSDPMPPNYMSSSLLAFLFFGPMSEQPVEAFNLVPEKPSATCSRTELKRVREDTKAAEKAKASGKSPEPKALDQIAQTGVQLAQLGAKRLRMETAQLKIGQLEKILEDLGEDDERRQKFKEMLFDARLELVDMADK